MKLTIYTIVTAAAANAQLQSVPGRLRSSAASNEWGRQRRTQIARSLESSMSFSMDFDASISMPELDDSSMSTSMSMVGDNMDWAVPDEPEIILDEISVTVEESETESAEEDGDETAEESAETSGEEDFVDGEFVDMKLE